MHDDNCMNLLEQEFAQSVSRHVLKTFIKLKVHQMPRFDFPVFRNIRAKVNITHINHVFLTYTRTTKEMLRPRDRKVVRIDLD